MAKKVFVLDTNVILHDFNSILNFQDNDVVIPVTVLEELDQFKKGNDQINYNAREFIRILDALSGDKLVKNGASLGEGRGKIRIITRNLNDPAVGDIFYEDNADHRILSMVLYLSRREKGKQAILVTKDINLRLKAKSLGLVAQDYFTDKIKDISQLYTGKRIVERVANCVFEKLHQEAGEIPLEDIKIEKPRPNEYLILRNGRHSMLAYYHQGANLVRRIEKQGAYGITPRNAEQTFALHALCNPEAQLVTLSGKAGTGKTLLALAAALEVRKRFLQIYLARPIIPLSNRDMGFLPGDIEAKLDPFMQPLYDNLNVIKNQFSEDKNEYKRIGEMLERQKLFIAPLAYIRGRSLDRIYFIVDEAQNLTPHEVKTIITRAGEGTKIIFTGDPYQIDTPYLDAQSNGLTYLIDRMKGQPIYAHVTLEKGERSGLADLASNLL